MTHREKVSGMQRLSNLLFLKPRLCDLTTREPQPGFILLWVGLKLLDSYPSGSRQSLMENAVCAQQNSNSRLQRNAGKTQCPAASVHAIDKLKMRVHG